MPSFKCGVKVHIASTCPTHQMSTVMPNDDDDVEKVEGDSKKAEK